MKIGKIHPLQIGERRRTLPDRGRDCFVLVYRSVAARRTFGNLLRDGASMLLADEALGDKHLTQIAVVGQLRHHLAESRLVH